MQVLLLFLVSQVNHKTMQNVIQHNVSQSLRIAHKVRSCCKHCIQLLKDLSRSLCKIHIVPITHSIFNPLSHMGFIFMRLSKLRFLALLCQWYHNCSKTRNCVPVAIKFCHNRKLLPGELFQFIQGQIRNLSTPITAQLISKYYWLGFLHKVQFRPPFKQYNFICSEFHAILSSALLYSSTFSFFKFYIHTLNRYLIHVIMLTIYVILYL